jgi:predicted RNA-binding Zn-ribbon protein involved in translation (DUF1610 family)
MATYYDLIIRCPACIADGGSGDSPSQWYHADCGGKIRVGDDAYFKCVSCGDNWHIRYSRYACREHESDYRSTTAAHFANAISTAGQITSVAGKKWLITLLENMGDDW